MRERSPGHHLEAFYPADDARRLALLSWQSGASPPALRKGPIRCQSGLQDDLALDVAAGLVRERGPRFRKRIHGADLSADLAGVAHPRDVFQLRSAGFADEVDGPNVRANLRRRKHHRHQRAAGLDDGNRASERVAANDVVDDVDLTDGVPPSVLLQIDEAIGA